MFLLLVILEFLFFMEVLREGFRSTNWWLGFEALKQTLNTDTNHHAVLFIAALVFMEFFCGRAL